MSLGGVLLWWESRRDALRAERMIEAWAKWPILKDEGSMIWSLSGRVKWRDDSSRSRWCHMYRIVSSVLNWVQSRI